MASDSASYRGHTQTQAYEVFEYRRFATWKGIGKAAAMILISLGIAVYVVVKSEIGGPQEPRFWYWIWGGPTAVLLPFGFWQWWKARHEDRVHRQFQQAPTLPLRLARTHDDAWIEGKLRCPRPLKPPHYSYRCSWYHLTVEERRGSGKNRRWVTILDETRRTRAWITDATHEIELDMSKASIDYPVVSTRSGGERKYTLRRMPAAGRASACGVIRYRHEVKGEDKHLAERRKAAERIASGDTAEERAIDARSPEDPDTPQPETKSFEVWRPHHERTQVREEKRVLSKRRRRARALRKARRKRERRERRQGRRRGGGREFRGSRYRDARDEWHTVSIDDTHEVPPEKRLLLTAHRHIPLMVTPLKRARWHDRSEADERTLAVCGDLVLLYAIPAAVWTAGCLAGLWAFAVSPGLPVGIGVMLALVLPSKIIGRYNRFVIYRQRIPNARAHLDVDLKMRHDLVPQLVKVVKGYVEVEKGALTFLTELRTRANGNDAVSGSLFALREAYPEIDAQPNFSLLFDDITALEEKIAFGRALLRDTVTEYNNTIGTFPSNLLAAVTGFEEEPLPA